MWWMLSVRSWLAGCGGSFGAPEDPGLMETVLLRSHRCCSTLRCPVSRPAPSPSFLASTRSPVPGDLPVYALHGQHAHRMNILFFFRGNARRRFPTPRQ